MKKRHIAFFTNETKAHTYSTLAIASVLLERGYRVTYATTQLAAPEITRTGAEAVIYRSLELDKKVMVDRPSPYDPKNWEAMMTFMIPGSVANAINALTQVADFYHHNPPDLILYDSDAYAGRFLAIAKGIPAIQISSNFAFYNEFHSYQTSPWPEPPAPEGTYEKLNQFFPLAFPIEKLNIYTIPIEFQANASSFDERFFFCGPCIRTPAGSTQKPTTGNEKPIILVSRSASISELDSDHEYFRTFIEALAGTEFNVILSTGSHMNPEALGPLPENFELNQHTPQYQIMPNASVFFGSGGAASTFEALYYGIPVILIPQYFFHAEFAHRVLELGLGIVIKNSELNAKAIRNAAVEAFTNQPLIEKVKAMQKSIREDGGPDFAADKIEEYLSS